METSCTREVVEKEEEDEGVFVKQSLSLYCSLYNYPLNPFDDPSPPDDGGRSSITHVFTGIRVYPATYNSPDDPLAPEHNPRSITAGIAFLFPPEIHICICILRAVPRNFGKMMAVELSVEFECIWYRNIDFPREVEIPPRNFLQSCSFNTILYTEVQ